MKSISIAKSLLLLILFIAAGCNFSRNNNQGSEPQQATDLLLENETDTRFSNARYAGEYIFNPEGGDDYGRVFIYDQTDGNILFDLRKNMGAPSYNSGELSGEVKIVDGKGLFKSSEYGDCILEFVFTDNSVTISQKEGGYECGFGMNVIVNDTFIREPRETFAIKEGNINEEILWDIFFKIPEENIKKNLFKTKHDRRKARLYSDVFVNDENENHLLYYEIDNYGAMNGNVMGIACFPTDDGKKIIALFYEERFDIGESQTNQTYEYDIASGALKSIECPIDLYAEDEFFDKSILTSEQFDEVRKFFPEKKYLLYVDVYKDVFAMRFSAHDVFEDWDEFKEYNKYAKRNWNGKRFVKSEQ